MPIRTLLGGGNLIGFFTESVGMIVAIFVLVTLRYQPRSERSPIRIKDESQSLKSEL